MFLPCWHYSLHHSENSGKKSLWQYQELLTSVCERWLFPGTQLRTQGNNGSVLVVILWWYTLVPWVLERTLAGGIALIHIPEVTCQGWKTWETRGAHSPHSAEDTYKAAFCNYSCKVCASSTLSVSSVVQKHDQPFKRRTTVLVQVSQIHKWICSCNNEQ